MSICSDVFISRQEARDRVKNELLYEQKKLIELAVKGMDDFELTRILNKDSDIYYYNIDKSKRKVDKDEEKD